MSNSLFNEHHRYVQDTIGYLKDSYVVWRFQHGNNSFERDVVRIEKRRALYRFLKEPNESTLRQARLFASDYLITRLATHHLKHIIRERSSSLERYCQMFDIKDADYQQETRIDPFILGVYENTQNEKRQLEDKLRVLNMRSLDAFVETQTQQIR